MCGRLRHAPCTAARHWCCLAHYWWCCSASPTHIGRVARQAHRAQQRHSRKRCSGARRTYAGRRLCGKREQLRRVPTITHFWRATLSFFFFPTFFTERLDKKKRIRTRFVWMLLLFMFIFKVQIKLTHCRMNRIPFLLLSLALEVRSDARRGT